MHFLLKETLSFPHLLLLQHYGRAVLSSPALTSKFQGSLSKMIIELGCFPGEGHGGLKNRICLTGMEWLPRHQSERNQGS